MPVFRRQVMPFVEMERSDPSFLQTLLSIAAPLSLIIVKFAGSSGLADAVLSRECLSSRAALPQFNSTSI